MVVIIMEKIRTSPLSIVFPWLSPLVIKFALVNGGIEVQLYRNNQPLKNWQASMLRHVLPEQFIRWIEDHHIHAGPQPYPLIKQLWQYLLPLASKKLIIDSSVLTELEEVSQPQDFGLIWTINRSLVCLEGRYEGADHYLGMGWFHKGTKIWSLNNHPSNAADLQLKNLLVPVQQADFLMNSIIPNLHYYLPTRADFQLITNFAIRVIVSNARSGWLTLALQCNYPQFLSTIQIPQQKVDVLFANQAIIRFPHQALTPALIQLLQGGAITIQGAGVPLFISEQLPILRHYYQISDDMVAKITQSNPIVSIATLRSTRTLIHKYENGIGKYIITATYQYQQHTLDMDALLAARGQNQRFVQQYAVWFEWPHNSYDLMNTIQQQRVSQVLRAEEVMGFDTRRVALLQNQPTAQAIQPDGTTSVERVQSVFAQLRHHGIPGGIVGEPTGTATMFINACEHLLRDNRQARILWLAPSNKKGSVTRAVNDSAIYSYVTVASLVTLRDEPALISHSWTLVIFQCLDQLLDGSAQSWTLFQLKWQWMLTSVTSKRGLSPVIMRVVHLSEQYYEQFCARYLFNLVNPETKQKPEQPLILQHGTKTLTKSAPLPIRLTIDLNQKKITRLHEESEQLQERLIVEAEEAQKQPSITFMPDPAPIVRETTGSAPEVDEDWQIILQQWQPEHWEIISLLCQKQSVQLTTAERKDHRPVSRLIDEINSPVDEQLGDLLIDPDTLTISLHLRTIAENLIRWYNSAKGR